MAAIVIISVVVLVFTWFVWPSRSTPPGGVRKERPDVDEQELEQAEREVQEAPDAETVRDWGPGTGQKPLP